MRDLRECFPHMHWWVRSYGGEPVGSEYALAPESDPIFGPLRKCGSWTKSEVEVLYNTALQVGGRWVDIGGLGGWTAAHLAMAGCLVDSIDPLYAHEAARRRALENLIRAGIANRVSLWAAGSEEFFAGDVEADGVVIDGDHDGEVPVKDAQAAVATGAKVILIHDLMLSPPRDAFNWLRSQGWKVEEFPLTHGVGVCWRGDRCE